MKNLTIENIAAACSGTIHRPAGAGPETDGREAEAVAIDSRLLTEGGVFIAARGERADGHDFIVQAAAKGALAAVCEELPRELPCPCILVQDSFQALRDIAGFYRRQLDITVIGITGSVGKTSAKEWIAGVLSESFPLWKTQGNYNNEVGLPLTVLQLRAEHRIAVLEMGVSGFGEMRRLSRIALPDVCVLTNIGPCHLELLGDRDGVLRAKTEMLEHWNQEGFLCLNGDDDKLIALKEKWGEKAFTFGWGSHNDYRGQITSRGLRGSLLTIEGRLSLNGAEISLPGGHMALNALAAAAVADRLGMSPEAIRKGMKRVEAVAGRSRVIALRDYALIDDCYNANPLSMRAALDLLQQAEGRRVAVLGDMFELGPEEERLHFAVGEYAAEGRADLLLCAGSLSAAIARGAGGAKGGKIRVYHVQTRDELYPLLEKTLLPGDTVLLKASHGMGFSRVAEWLAAASSPV